MIDKIVKKVKEELLNEVTSSSVSKGAYISPLLPGLRDFGKNKNAPFTEYINDFDSAFLDYDSLDGKVSVSKKKAKEIEKKAERITNYIMKNPEKFAWADEAGIINGGPKHNTDSKPIKLNKKGTISKNIKTSLKEEIITHSSVNEWKYEEAPILTEDLAVWFGTKKKPKGSSQPKGPWVNICRKVDGKHPPCGRSEADTKGYPKCRAAGVAGKMTQAQKQAACAQKRRAEKKDPKIGTGNKPTMTSYKPKKK
jgi:hypothetical protein